MSVSDKSVRFINNVSASHATIPHQGRVVPGLVNLSETHLLFCLFFFNFLPGGHLLAFLTCLENGLAPKLQLDPLASIEHLLCGNVKRESEKGDRDGAEAESVEASRCQRSQAPLSTWRQRHWPLM